MVTPQRCQGTVDFDHHDPRLGAHNLHEIYADLRSQEAIAQTEACGGYWLLTRYADVDRAARSWEEFSSAHGVHLPRAEGQQRIIPIDYDPPVHGPYRTLFNDLLGPRQVRANESAIRWRIARLVDELLAAPAPEFVGTVAAPLPIGVVCELLGVSSESSEQVRALTEAMWPQFGRVARPDALAQLVGLVTSEVLARRDEPQADGLTHIAEAEIDGRLLNEAEISSMLIAFLVAGHETTMNAAGWLVLELANNESLQTDLREHPDRIAAAVEESLRRDTPAHLFFRRAATDTAIGGCPIGRGDWVALVYAAANRDPAMYDEPDEFKLDRSGPRHLAFGIGTHFCPGATLARVELKLLAEDLLGRPERFRLAGDVTFSDFEGGHHLGVRQLPLEFSR